MQQMRIEIKTFFCFVSSKRFDEHENKQIYFYITCRSCDFLTSLEAVRSIICQKPPAVLLLFLLLIYLCNYNKRRFLMNTVEV